MMHLAVLLPVVVLVIACVPVSAWQNEFDQLLFMTCPTNQFVYRVRSYHSNSKEDRRWQYDCKSFPGATINNPVWSGYVNNYDGLLAYRCPGNAVITGVISVHSNSKEDRIFRFRCSTISPFVKNNCYITPNYINNWDAWMDYTVPANYVIVGFTSYHDNGREDRRWKVEICNCV